MSSNKNSVNILHFGLSANQGGIETYLLKISRLIDKSRFRFSFIDITGGKACFKNELEELGFSFHEITPRKISFSKNRKELELLFKLEQFDILHFHANTLSYMTPILVALEQGVKVIIHSRNAGSGGSLMTRLLHHVNKIRLPFFKTRCIAVSKEAGEWLFGRNVPYEVYNNGIDLNRFKFVPEGRQQVRNEFEIAENEVLIGNVGAFLPAKNHSLILDIFKFYTENQLKAKLLLVGTGNKRNEMKEKAAKLGIGGKVIFAGRRSDMPNIYSAMDLFLFPSLFEGFPNAVLEAQACGLPCLVSDVITDEVLVTENTVGMSLSNNAQKWAARLDELVAISRNSNRMGVNSFLEKMGYGVSSEIKRLENLYSTLIQESMPSNSWKALQNLTRD